ncbi:carbon-nitrogen hydrolase [Colletotrichum plurivorum]|uniref:Carbon-nitrogen hydrolase n=1 Tax=Colletotrichum plurivorum TaxID=2175906 RepID=A0A8H6KQ05_9PEZI|nr:carbon-nitrogen hydrolase [Colletotrichum plurivorum]
MASTRPIVKVAAVQAAPVSFDLARSLQKLSKLTAEAAEAGADLVVFPEGFLSAYPWRYAFDATIGAREPRGTVCSDNGPSLRVLRVDTAQDDNGSPSTSIRPLKFLRLHLTYCLTQPGRTMCCCMLASSKRQVARSTARRCCSTGMARWCTNIASCKLIPTAAERLVWGRGAGDGLKVSQTDVGKVGSLICWENYMPMARMALYQQGIEIYIAPNADDLPAWTASMQHIAKEGRCFVVSVNSVCKVSDFPPDYPPFTAEHPDRRPDGAQWEADDIVNHGGSCVVGPLGTFLAEPVWDKEEIIYADLKMADITESRLDFDPVGSYSRPDVFSLTVNTKPGTNVAFTS